MCLRHAAHAGLAALCAALATFLIGSAFWQQFQNPRLLSFWGLGVFLIVRREILLPPAGETAVQDGCV